MSPSGSPTWCEAGDDTKRRHVDQGERRSEERSKKKKREKRDRSDDRSERRHRRDDKGEKGKAGRSSRLRRSPSRSPVNSSPEKQPSSARRREERSRERSHGSKRSQRSGESRDSKKKQDSRHRKRSRERERARSRSRSEQKNNRVGPEVEGVGGGGGGKGEKGRSRSRSVEGRTKGGEGNDKGYGFPPGRVNSFDAALKRSKSRDREEKRGASPSGAEGRKRVRRRSPDKGSREDMQIPMFPGVGMGYFPRGFMPPGEFGWGHGMMPMEGPMPPFFRGGRGDPQFMRGGARPPRGGRGSFRGGREMTGMGRGGRWQQGGRGFDGAPRGRFAGRGWQGRGPPGPNWDDMPMGGALGFGGPAPPPHGIYGPPPTGPMPPPPTQAPSDQVKDGHQLADGVQINASQGPMPENGGAAPDGLRVSPVGVPGGPGVMSQRGGGGGGPLMGSAATEPGMQQQSSPHGPRQRGPPHGAPGAGIEPSSYMAGDGRMMPPPHGTQKHGRPNAAAHDHKQKHAPDEHSRGRRGSADAMRGAVVGGNGEERQHGNKRAHAGNMQVHKKQSHADELRGKEAGRSEKQKQQQQKERQLLKTEAAAHKTEDTDVAAPEAQVKTEELSSEEKARKEEQLKAEQERVEGYLGVASKWSRLRETSTSFVLLLHAMQAYTLRGITVPASLAGRHLARAVRLLKRRGLEYDRWCREGEKDGEARSVLTLLMEGDGGHADEVEEEEEAVYLSGHDEEGEREGDGHVGSGEHAMAADSAHVGGHAHDAAGDGLYGDMEGGDMGDLYGDLEEEAAHAAKREDPMRIIADLNALRAPVIHEPTMTMQEADRLQRLFVDVSQALQAQAVG